MSTIRYGDLPTAKTCNKLLALSFDSPSKNLSVYRFITALMEHIKFVENERNKLLEKCCQPVPGNPGTYTITDVFKEKFGEVLKMEVDSKYPIPIPDLTEDDFYDSRCQYPTEKEMWMNGSEIISIIEIIKKFNK